MAKRDWRAFPSSFVNYESRTKAKAAYKAKIREWYEDVMDGATCEHCGSTRNLLWHHRDPEDKAFNIGCCDRSIATMITEMEKCDLTCRKCHLVAHGKNRRVGHGW